MNAGIWAIRAVAQGGNIRGGHTTFRQKYITHLSVVHWTSFLLLLGMCNPCGHGAPCWLQRIGRLLLYVLCLRAGLNFCPLLYVDDSLHLDWFGGTDGGVHSGPLGNLYFS